jgi:putative transposase
MKDFLYLKKLCGEEGCKKEVTVKYEYGKYYMVFPFVYKKQTTRLNGIIALDPGVRCFQTGYDLEGRFIEYGKQDISRIFEYGLKMDELCSRIAKTKQDKYTNKKEREQFKNKRRCYRKQLEKLRFKVKNLIHDAHCKIVLDLCRNYKYILISRFKVSDMVKRMSRKINNETVRKMLNWSHFAFRQRLNNKAEMLGCRVFEVSEHYTSKMCGRCGNINWELSGEKLFVCPKCPFVLHRDFNGARNIMLMNLENCIGQVVSSTREEKNTPFEVLELAPN